MYAFQSTSTLCHTLTIRAKAQAKHPHLSQLSGQFMKTPGLHKRVTQYSQTRQKQHTRVLWNHFILLSVRWFHFCSTVTESWLYKACSETWNRWTRPNGTRVRNNQPTAHGRACTRHEQRGVQKGKQSLNTTKRQKRDQYRQNNLSEERQKKKQHTHTTLQITKVAHFGGSRASEQWTQQNDLCPWAVIEKPSEVKG